MRYAVINRPTNELSGDEFVEFYKTKEEAIRQADPRWPYAGLINEDYEILEIFWDSEKGI